MKFDTGNKLARLFKEELVLPELLGVTAEAEERRNELALAARTVTSVACAAEQQTAADVARDLQSYLRDAADAGLEFRRPLTAFNRTIKSTEDGHLAPLVAEKERLGRLLADFAAKEARRVATEEAERRRQFDLAEAARLDLEQRAAEAAAAGRTKTAAKLEARAAAAEAAVQAEIAAPMPEASKAAGVGVKRLMKWEVTDMLALAKSRPELVKMEAKGSAIQALCVPGMPDPPPGLRLWWESVAVVARR